MTNRAFWIFAAVLSLLIGAQVGVVFYLRGAATAGSLFCRVVNAGVPLGARDSSILVYPAGRRDEPVARGTPGTGIQVPAGIYDVHVLYTRSHDHQEAWLENIPVAAGERAERQVEFSAGQLAVDVMVGGRPSLAANAQIQIVTPDNPRRVVAALASGEVAFVRAGVYDLRVALLDDAQEKDVQWLRGVEVGAGVLARPRVAFRQGQLLVRASNAGEELPPDAATLSVYRAGDTQEELVASGRPAVPLVLATGRYDLKVTFTASSDAAARWIRDVEIRERETTEQTVGFSAGTAVVSARMTGGPELTGFQVYVYFYAPDDHQQPVTYSTAGQRVVLSAGRYDLRANFFRSHDQPDIWKRGIEIRPGETLAETVGFPSGTLLIRAYGDGGRELVGDNVFLYFYKAGERSTPVARARGGEAVTLTEGAYDVRASDSRARAAEQWLRNVNVESGKSIERGLKFPS